MKIQRILVATTLVNVGLLLFLLTQMRPVEAQGVATVLRARALEIVDNQGRVRASVKIEPAGQAPNGEPYPETVMFRLIDPNGRPSVKLGASVQGAGLGLGGESDSTYAILKAEGPESSLKLMNKDGRQHVINP